MSLPTKRSTLSQTALFCLEAVSLCLILATTPLSRSAVLLHSSAPGFFYFVTAHMIAVIGTCIVLCARRWGNRKRSAAVILVLFIALHAAGAVSLAFAQTSLLPESVLVACGAACGVGVVPVVVFFAHSLVQDSLGKNMIVVALAFGSAACLYWIAASLPHPNSKALYLVLLAIGSLGCLASLFLQKRIPVESKSEPDPETSDGERVSSVSKLISIAGVPLFGVFAFAVFIEPSTSLDSARPTLFGFDEELLLFLAAAAIIAVIGASMSKKPLLSATYQVGAPIMVSAILVCLSFPHLSPVHQAGSALVVLMTAFAIIFATAVICTIVESGEAPVSYAFCSILTVYALGRIVGIAFHSAIAVSNNAYAAYQIMVTVLLSAMLLLTVLQSRAKNASRNICSAKDISAIVEAACDCLKQQYDLTAQESDVLKFLARGYSPAYVADALVIAESTARTHTQHLSEAGYFNKGRALCLGRSNLRG